MPGPVPTHVSWPRSWLLSFLWCEEWGPGSSRAPGTGPGWAQTGECGHRADQGPGHSGTGAQSGVSSTGWRISVVTSLVTWSPVHHCTSHDKVSSTRKWSSVSSSESEKPMQTTRHKASKLEQTDKLWTDKQSFFLKLKVNVNFSSDPSWAHFLPTVVRSLEWELSEVREAASAGQWPPWYDSDSIRHASNSLNHKVWTAPKYWR